MNHPRVSIMIPGYQSTDTIADCLRGLREQTFGDFEVIVVNSSRDDATQRLVEANFPDALFEQAPDRLLPHAARNRAAARARGELLVFTDPDCRSHRDWLELMIKAHDAGHQLVCGAIELSDDARWFERGVHLCKYSFRLSHLHSAATWIAGTANASCTREVWNAVGPFDGKCFAGDALFSWRATAHGWKPWFEPSAVVVHRYRGSMMSLIRERFLRGDDFAAARMQFEGWTRARAAAHVVALPLALGIVLARGWKDAVAVGRGWTFIETLPVQIAGHAAWLAGEARSYYRRMVRRVSSSATRIKSAVTVDSITPVPSRSEKI
jgi:glycosyltransferase involved in cell wall biosynthesis